MNHHFFAVLVLLPSVGFVFAILSTYYGWTKAYLAISWIPVTFYMLINLLLQMDYAQHQQTIDLQLMLESVVWTSFIQAILGIAIVTRALVKKRDWVLPAIAALLAVIPFLLAR